MRESALMLAREACQRDVVVTVVVVVVEDVVVEVEDVVVVDVVLVVVGGADVGQGPSVCVGLAPRGPLKWLPQAMMRVLFVGRQSCGAAFEA
jgi:hypothetical protein